MTKTTGTIAERTLDLLSQYTGRRRMKIVRMVTDYWAVDTIVKVETACGMVCLVWLDGSRAGEIEEGSSW